MSEVNEKALVMLKEAQAGSDKAQDELIEFIRLNMMGRRIGRYLNKNRQVDNDDIKQEFMIGVALNIQTARMDIGDPVEYLIHKGLYRVRTYMRKHIIQGTMQVCMDCGAKGRLNRVGNEYVCKKCGSTNVSTTEINDYDEITLNNVMEDGFESDSISGLVISEFEKTLMPGTNVYNLYQLLKNGVDRDNPDIKNYIKYIAKIWGGCSDQNVVQALDKLRYKFDGWLKDNHMARENNTIKFNIIGG